MIKGFIFIEYENEVHNLPILNPEDYDITTHEQAKEYIKLSGKEILKLNFVISGYMYTLTEKGKE